MTADAPLYQRLVGDAAWAQLPAVTRALHTPDPSVLFEGEAEIARGSHPMARLAAAMLRLPASGSAVPARVKVSLQDEGELLERWYGGRRFATVQGERNGQLYERFGPFRLSFRLTGGPEGVDFHQEGVALWFLPLPAALAPRVEARERADGEVHVFNVRLSLPGIGLVIAYRGRLRGVG
tara:strand:+ start:13943 stop:14482 length:540 start_codon:yes stop_codon:yes gene_type:complete